ncbi:MAG: phosphate ABC transporter substrate-binding protein PstS [Lawsonella sp.]|uniref:phosphate ABC transporter substrate-binding protein PstS n=1 Tax=Lawsonella sp. TaxID=2041415 RepID=UPI002A751751|nr:phosphate ABC transporter substrate-binding protein PstS [Lawsonella sp.]MDY2978893.1 phosphate ABC transporter substrate-binding protein PstS [Lawsonella sp.]
MDTLDNTAFRPRRTGARIAMTLLALGTTSAVLTACGGNPDNTRGTLTGEGATSQQNAINLFADVLIREHGINLAYNATGSGAGVQKFLESVVVFGGSDSPLDEDEAQRSLKRCKGHPAWHLPLVISPVAIAYNLPGVDGLALTPDTLALIFNGGITTWNDPRLQKLNPGKNLPDEHISVIFRSDKSGTTDNVQKFLTYTAPKSWKSHATGKVWQGVGNGAQGSAGVAGDVMGNKYAITYVEGGYAAKMQKARLDFGSGPVAMTDQSAGRALDHIRFRDKSFDRVVDTKHLYTLNKPGAYPFLLTTYEIFCSAGYSPADRDRLQTFLHSALTEGQKVVSTHGYIPLPPSYQKKLMATVEAANK